MVQPIAIYDESLYERTRTQWQFGDWNSLTRIEHQILQDHPERAKLALMVAAGHLQSDNATIARRFIKLAQDWGCSRKLVSQILVAGVHNSLGRAAAVANQQDRSYEHFEAAIAIGTPGTERKLLTQARVNEQYASLGLAVSRSENQPALKQTSGKGLRQRILKVETGQRHELGNAWAGNTVNTVIFRHHGIFTHGRYQYTAFYADKHVIRFVQRDLETEGVTVFDLRGDYNLKDAHNSISMGIDRSGMLHVCYDHHASKLFYRRSFKPHCITDWSEELPMTGKHEEKVTYPTFILPHHGFPLTLLYRDGVHNQRDGASQNIQRREQLLV